MCGVRPLATRAAQTVSSHPGVGCGRPEDALQELAEGFLAEFNSSWRQHGPEALTRLSTERAAQSRAGAAPLKTMCRGIGQETIPEARVSTRVLTCIGAATR